MMRVEGGVRKKDSTGQELHHLAKLPNPLLSTRLCTLITIVVHRFIRRFHRFTPFSLLCYTPSFCCSFRGHFGNVILTPPRFAYRQKL